MGTISQFDFIARLLYTCGTYKEIIMVSLVFIFLAFFLLINLFSAILQLPHLLSIFAENRNTLSSFDTAIVYLLALTCGSIIFLIFKRKHKFNADEAKGLIATSEEIMRSFDATKVRRQYINTFSKIISNQIKTNDKFISHNKEFSELDQLKLLIKKTDDLRSISENIKEKG